MAKSFSRTEFVTVNMIKDWINSIRDLLGLEQKTYAEVVNAKTEEILKNIENKGELLWFRQEVEMGFGTSLRIIIYGQYKPFGTSNKKGE